MTDINQIDTISRNGVQVADYDYQGARMVQLTYNGTEKITADHLYDGAGRLTRLIWSSDSNVLPDFSYYYDKAGNILSKKHEHRTSNPAEDYIYDTLYQLTQATYNYRAGTPYQGFFYDDLGNQLTFDDNGSQITYLHNKANEITKAGASQVLYDRNGNLTKDDKGYSYHYDYENQLVSVKKTNAPSWSPCLNSCLQV